jgi:hypothetical protein
MQDALIVKRIKRKFLAMAPLLDERSRRQWAAAEAMELPYGGISLVAAATGFSRTTITVGIAELRTQVPDEELSTRIRRPGGGRKYLEESDPDLWKALDALIDPATRGDPESPLRWTCKSTRRLAEELCKQGHPISARKVAAVLYEMGYSLQANRKTRDGAQHPDRNAQFEYIKQPDETLAKTRPAGGIGGHEKEGIAWRFQESWARVAAPRGA